MPDFLKTRWVLFLVLVVFILCKIPHLFYPYYWDESWPYAVAIKDMYTHGISLMPSAVDPELSRGHPLFFHAIAALWMNIFGASHLSMHSFALSISVLFLVAVYEVGFRLFNQQVAVLSLLLVATQVVFFVQSSFVLFEMLVAFLAFLSLYFYIRGKYFLTILCLSALFYTKESGLVMGIVLGIDAIAGLFNKTNEWRRRLLSLASIVIPCMLIGIFFMLQKHIRGWYIFPFYNDLIEHRWASFWYNFRRNSLRNIFHDQLNYSYFILFLGVSLVAGVKNKNLKYLAVFLPAFIIYCVIDDHHSVTIYGIAFFLLFAFSVVVMLYALKQLRVYRAAVEERWVVLSCSFIFCFFCFSSMNFFTFRYLLPAIVLLFFFIAVIIDKFIDRSYPVLYYPALLLILLIGFFSFKKDNDYGDTHLKAFYGMDVQQSVVDYLEKKNDYDKIIGTGSFLESQHLINPATGFLHTGKAFKNVSWYIDRKTDYAIFDNLEPDNRYNDFKKDTGFHLVYQYQKGEKWAEIYYRK